jgi:hypothetical protein
MSCRVVSCRVKCFLLKIEGKFFKERFCPRVVAESTWMLRLRAA